MKFEYILMAMILIFTVGMFNLIRLDMNQSQHKTDLCKLQFGEEYFCKFNGMYDCNKICSGTECYEGTNECWNYSYDCQYVDLKVEQR